MLFLGMNHSAPKTLIDCPGNPLGGCEIQTLKQMFKKNELFAHYFYASLAKVMYEILTSYILDLQASC